MQLSFSLNNFGVSSSASNPGDGVSEVVLSLSHQRRKKLKQNKTAQYKNKKNPTKCPKFKCNTVSVSFSACRCSSVVSSKTGRKNKESGDNSVNVYLRLWLTFPLLSACYCWRLYLCRS
jgi:hypothetical protein